MEPQATTTARYIALLRAINVGGHVVKIADLRRLFEALGFANVATFIASGNVIFDAPAEARPTLEGRIEGHLRQALGYDVATFVRSPAEVAAVARYQPFPPADRSGEAGALYIAFLRTAPGAEAVRKLLAFQSPVDAFHIQGRELYWLCRTRLSESRFSGALLEKTIGLPATVRNATTVGKLAAQYGAPPPPGG